MNKSTEQTICTGNRLGYNHRPFSSQSTREVFSSPSTWIVNPKRMGKKKEKDELWEVWSKTLAEIMIPITFESLISYCSLLRLMCAIYLPKGNLNYLTLFPNLQYILKYPKMLHTEGWEILIYTNPQKVFSE